MTNDVEQRPDSAPIEPASNPPSRFWPSEDALQTLLITLTLVALAFCGLAEILMRYKGW